MVYRYADLGSSKQPIEVERIANTTTRSSITQQRHKLKGFKISHLNIRSLVKNIDQFRIYSHNCKFDIICLSETMLDGTIQDYEVNVNGYEVIRKDRNRNGGGVAIYIRNCISYKLRPDLDHANLESITIEIFKPKAKSFLINTWYRPPGTSLDLFSDYEECITKMDYENKEVITIGDFNCDWNNLGERTISPQTKRIVDLAQTFQYEQLIKESTRITETSSTLIDLAFSNKPELIIDSGVEHIGISDHSMIYVCRKVSIPRKEPKIVNTRQYKYFEINAFRSDLNEIFQIQSNLTNPNILWEEWKSKFLAVADLHAPPITRKVRSEYAPWITENIKKSMKNRDYLKKRPLNRAQGMCTKRIKEQEMK